MPGPRNPIAWDRFAYVFNNPIRYTDPSGHCGADKLESKTEQCEALQSQIEDYFHINITGKWTYAELLIVFLALQDIENGLGGVNYFIEEFAGMTINRNRHRKFSPNGGEVLGAVVPSVDINVIQIYDGAFSYGDNIARFTIIHESIHVWDFRNNIDLSVSHADAISAGCLPDTKCGFDGQPGYVPDIVEQPYSSYAYSSPYEDVANTLTAVFFRGDWTDPLMIAAVVDIGSPFFTPVRTSWARLYLNQNKITTTKSFSTGQ